MPANYKEGLVKDFVKLLDDYPIVGAVNMESLPTPQLQTMRANLRDTVLIKMTKRRLINKAIEKCKKENIKDLVQYLKGMPALIFTKDNPFKLFATLKKSKSKAPAKAGQIAPSDVIVEAGPTPFAPGPIIGELGALGLKTGVENGKVAIKEKKVVVKEGEEIKENVAAVLTRLGIKPMEIGLDLVAIYENGVIYTKSVLDIDEDEFREKLSTAANWAFSLALESGYPTKETVEYSITSCAGEALALAREANILVPELAEEILAKAQGQATALAGEAGFEVNLLSETKPLEKSTEEVKEPKKEEKPPADEKSGEDKKEETKAVKADTEPTASIEEKSPEETEDDSDEKIEESKSDKKESPVEEETKLSAGDNMKTEIQVKPETLPEKQNKDIEVKKPSAVQLVDEIKKEDEIKKKQAEETRVPTAHELAERRNKQS
jgi:large subunit ribosomal protein L10